MSMQDLLPREVVIDLVLKYSATMPAMGHAAVLHGNLIVATRNHLGSTVSFSLPVHFTGKAFAGDQTTPPRFVLFELGDTVWKLAPSIKHDLLHAYLTIIDVPKDITWGVREALEATP